VQVWALVHTGGADVNRLDPTTGCSPAGLAARAEPAEREGLRSAAVEGGGGGGGGTLLLATLHAASVVRRTQTHMQFMQWLQTELGQAEEEERETRRRSVGVPLNLNLRDRKGASPLETVLCTWGASRRFHPLPTHGSSGRWIASPHKDT
jgi:hypothetical protein